MRAALGFLVVLGCAGGPGRSGGVAQGELARALAARDPVALGRLLEVEPGSIDLSEAGVEVSALGPVVAAAPLEERARVYAGDRAVVLVREPGGWRVDRGLFGAPVLATPEDALAALAAAVRRVRVLGVERVLGRAARAELRDELGRWERGLADPLAVPIEVDGVHATARLPTGLVLHLVQEAGEWRLDGVHE